VEKNAAGPITAADIETDEAVEVLNKDHVLATLTDNVPFVMEMVVENGIIPIDAVYSPVVRVRYGVEETRVGQKTNYDKLTLEIWTNGSVAPEMAMVEAAKILRKHLNPFVQYTELGPQVRSPARETSLTIDSNLESKLNLPLSELNLSVRASNCLDSENIMTVRDLVTRSEDQLLEVRNFGETTLTEVRHKLRDLGLHLGMRLPAQPAGIA
jgi:DNA-directed RNA polymerase subunit alpha